MASRGYMGPSEVQALIGKWVELVGKDGDDRDRDRDDHDRKNAGRGDYGRDQQQTQWWLSPPPWWTGDRKQWRQYPAWYQQQQWYQGQQPQQGYPYPYPQPPYQQPYQPPYQQPYQPQSRPGYHWVPAYGATPGHWERDRAYVTPTYGTPPYGTPPYGSPYISPSPVVRDHRGGGGVSVITTPGQQRQQGVQNLTGPGLGDYFSSLFGGTGTISGADLSGPGGMMFAPRAALVDAPAPTQANRDILPMSTGVPILPTQSAQITGRPQVMAFKANTYKISDAGTAGGAADWIVNDIKIGNRSQFVQSGDVPGDIFGTRAVDTFVRFETAQTAMDIVVVVTYIGLNESGCPFFSAMIGTSAI